jgi:hypothetical protein
VRTTVTLDPDTEAVVKKMMGERGISFKEAVNAAIRAGISSERPSDGFSTPTFSMGAHPHVDLVHSLRLAGELEAAEVAHEVAARK